MKCCCQPYDAVFDEKRAGKDVKRYKKKGLTKETKILFDFLKDKVKGKSILEIGCGIGDLGIELVKCRTMKYEGADISKAYIGEANKMKSENNFEDKMKFFNMDFVENSGKFDKTDVVASNKVICCYPDYEKFIKTTASYAKKFYCIVYPKDNRIIKLFAKLLNFGISFTKINGFKFYVHDNEKITKLIKSNGFEQIFRGNTFMWNVDIWQKSN